MNLVYDEGCHKAALPERTLKTLPIDMTDAVNSAKFLSQWGVEFSSLRSQLE
jgi:hypothetical protein